MTHTTYIHIAHIIMHQYEGQCQGIFGLFNSCTPAILELWDMCHVLCVSNCISAVT